jgi:hypothetical protein
MKIFFREKLGLYHSFTQPQKIEYAEYVVPHVLPETKKRLTELEAEMMARVNWEKEQAGED